MTDLKDEWAGHYAGVAETLDRMSAVKTVATAFNTNIDAVIKISGKKLADLIAGQRLSWDELNRIEHYSLEEPVDVVKGVFRCFSRGIAEEWLANRQVYDWMVNNIGYDRLQMGGQGGIVANVLAVCRVEKVVNHCASLPEQQAKLFLDLDNLLAVDEGGKIGKARNVNRQSDTPLIHWIIEFDKNDEFVLGEHKVVCPKSNRFIATYDPLNSHLVIDENYVSALEKNVPEAVVLSGYHALTAEQDGVALVKKSLPIIEAWQKNGSLVHLEVASTQDVIVRKAIVEYIAARADSIGLNERETIEVLQVIGEDSLAKICDDDCSAENILQAVLTIKQKVGCKRVQLHMFGLYMTLQDKGFAVTPEQNRNGMCLAATVAAGKAGTGHLNAKENLMWAKGHNVCDCGLACLQKIAEVMGDKAFAETGIGSYHGFDIIAVPTILVEKPVTLVGMGDTISSVSLIGALKA